MLLQTIRLSQCELMSQDIVAVYLSWSNKIFWLHAFWSHLPLMHNNYLILWLVKWWFDWCFIGMMGKIFLCDRTTFSIDCRCTWVNHFMHEETYFIFVHIFFHSFVSNWKAFLSWFISLKPLWIWNHLCNWNPYVEHKNHSRIWHGASLCHAHY